jgi:hypothetical protein
MADPGLFQTDFSEVQPGNYTAKTLYRKLKTNIPRNEIFHSLIPNSNIHVSEGDLYIPRMGLPIFLF